MVRVTVLPVQRFADPPVLCLIDLSGSEAPCRNVRRVIAFLDAGSLFTISDSGRQQPEQPAPEQGHHQRADHPRAPSPNPCRIANPTSLSLVAAISRRHLRFVFSWAAHTRMTLTPRVCVRERAGDAIGRKRSLHTPVNQASVVITISSLEGSLPDPFLRFAPAGDRARSRVGRSGGWTFAQLEHRRRHHHVNRQPDAVRRLYGGR